MSKKIAYPTPTTGKQHAYVIAYLRAALDRAAAQLDISPSVAGDIATQIQALYAKYGITPALPDTQTVVSTGQKVDSVTTSGTGTFATFTVAGGKVTAVTFSNS